ncbi:MAG: site-specific integrase [Candidatus Latescibacteria bacterium]|nr:site-specific integrase [Candidatus Latescibacterota bacterium]
MASVLHEKKLKRWRISFALRLPAGPVYRSRYARDRAEADQLRRLLEALETATRIGLAKASQIEDWIARGWLQSTEALAAFAAWREAGGPTLRRPVDLDALRRAYEDYALQHSKASSPFRASHKSHLALAGQVLAWLEEAHPRLDLSPGDVERWHYRGRPIGSKALTRAFARVVTGEKLHPDLTLYCLRHTYASALLRAGVDLRTVQARLGHSDLKTTMTYLHALEAEAHPTDALPY